MSKNRELHTEGQLIYMSVLGWQHTDIVQKAKNNLNDGKSIKHQLDALELNVNCTLEAIDKIRRMS